jgi:hypothetical protein
MLVFLETMLAWTLCSTMILLEKIVRFENVSSFPDIMSDGTLCGTMIMLEKKQSYFQNVDFFKKGYVGWNFM